MVEVQFQGWFQCRLATDTDPSDESRGVSGWTYAYHGEPDLDRIIRTLPAGTVNRPFSPTIGVRVSSVAIDGEIKEKHPLIGATVALLDNPVFEGRNGLAFEDTEEPIFPFHIEISGNDLRLRREYREISSGAWAMQRSLGVIPNPKAVVQAGIVNEGEYVKKRRTDLEQALVTETDPSLISQFKARLAHMKQRGRRRNTDAISIMPMFIGLRYRYVLDGPWYEVQAPRSKMGARVDSGPWIADLWVGCWDGDLLAGFIVGSLLLPSR